MAGTGLAEDGLGGGEVPPDETLQQKLGGHFRTKFEDNFSTLPNGSLLFNWTKQQLTVGGWKK